MVARAGLDEELRRERVTFEEVRQVLRPQGVASLHEAGAVVLEPMVASAS